MELLCPEKGVLMVSVERVESLKGFYFVGNHGVLIRDNTVRIGDIRLGMTISVAELDAIHKLIHEGE